MVSTIDILAFSDNVIVESEDLLKFSKLMTLNGAIFGQNEDTKALFIKHRPMFRLGTLFTLANLELAIIIKHLVKAETKHEKHYFAKQCYLTVYEVLKNYDSHKKELNTIAKTHEGVLNILKECKSDFRAFHNIYPIHDIHTIRNKVAAHIDIDLDHYFEVLDGLDAQKAVKMSFQFLYIISKLNGIIPVFIASSNLTLRDDLQNLSLEERKELLGKSLKEKGFKIN